MNQITQERLSMNPTKKKVAIVSAAGCRGCEHAILNVHHQVQSFSRWIDIVYWPYLLGSDPEELEALESIDVCFFAGAVTTDAERAMAEQLRSKSDVMVACGACAAFGGMPGLANIKKNDSTTDSEPDEGDETLLPKLEHRVASLDQVVAVDYVIPGCQPTQSLLWAGIQALTCGPRSQSKLSFAAARLPVGLAQAITAGITPPKGSVFAGDKAVCASCSRLKEEKKFTSAVRPYEKYEESGRCLLEQGLICLGISTREGCGGLCTGVGQPCRGCFGKPEAVYDPGAKMVSAVSSTFASEKKEEIVNMAAVLKDLTGTFYRYTIASQCALMDKE
jgi:F420-non-reducing hydrogenase small subunit